MSTADLTGFVLALLGMLGCGLVAGVFFAFSAFVMKALARLAPAGGIAAMQSINMVVLRSWFMAAFLGTALVCAVALVYSLWWWDQPGAVFLFSGSVLYLVGGLLVTMVFNVPRNRALALVSPADPNAATQWAGYVASWTAWNHVRTVASLAAAVLFIIALAY